MASRKIETYQNKVKNLYKLTIYFVFDLNGECKVIKNIIVIKEICSS